MSEIIEGQQTLDKEEFRRQFDEWREKTYQLFLRWEREEGLTVDQCNERFWGKELLKAWREAV